MKKIAAWIVLALILAFMVVACGEKSCNNQGDRKYVGGDGVYVCSDRHDGAGLRWYKESGAIVRPSVTPFPGNWKP